MDGPAPIRRGLNGTGKIIFGRPRRISVEPNAVLIPEQLLLNPFRDFAVWPGVREEGRGAFRKADKVLKVGFNSKTDFEPLICANLR